MDSACRAWRQSERDDLRFLLALTGCEVDVIDQSDHPLQELEYAPAELEGMMKVGVHYSQGLNVTQLTAGNGKHAYQAVYVASSRWEEQIPAACPVVEKCSPQLDMNAWLPAQAVARGAGQPFRSQRGLKVRNKSCAAAGWQMRYVTARRSVEYLR